MVMLTQNTCNTYSLVNYCSIPPFYQYTWNKRELNNECSPFACSSLIVTTLKCKQARVCDTVVFIIIHMYTNHTRRSFLMAMIANQLCRTIQTSEQNMYLCCLGTQS